MPSFSFTLVDSGGSSSATVVVAPGGDTPPAKRDFTLDAGGDLDLSTGSLTLTTKAVAIAQALLIALRTVLGEWFLDTLNVGVPVYQDVLVKNPNLDVVRSTYRTAALKVLGVTDLVSIDLDYSSSDRSLDVSLVADSDAGLLEINLQTPTATGAIQ